MRRRAGGQLLRAMLRPAASASAGSCGGRFSARTAHHELAPLEIVEDRRQRGFVARVRAAQRGLRDARDCGRSASTSRSGPDCRSMPRRLARERLERSVLRKPQMEADPVLRAGHNRSTAGASVAVGIRARVRRSSRAPCNVRFDHARNSLTGGPLRFRTSPHSRLYTKAADLAQNSFMPNCCGRSKLAAVRLCTQAINRLR